MQNQQRLNRRRRNLPGELVVEIADYLPPGNAVHFLANVPNRLIIHHCAPRVRRILKMIRQIAADYARTLPAPDYHGYIHPRNGGPCIHLHNCIQLHNGHKYMPNMDIFLRYGAAHCGAFFIWRGTSDRAFVGYPANFFDDLIKYYHETKVPTKAIRHLHITLPLANPAPWPAALFQPQAKLEFYNGAKWIRYILRNKHNSGIAFKLGIHFQGNAKFLQQMTGFEVLMGDI